MVAENIAKNINFSDPVDTAIDGWMKSDGHRANILTALMSGKALTASELASS